MARRVCFPLNRITMRCWNSFVGLPSFTSCALACVAFIFAQISELADFVFAQVKFTRRWLCGVHSPGVGLCSGIFGRLDREILVQGHDQNRCVFFFWMGMTFWEGASVLRVGFLPSTWGFFPFPRVGQGGGTLGRWSGSVVTWGGGTFVRFLAG